MKLTEETSMKTTKSYSICRQLERTGEKGVTTETERKYSHHIFCALIQHHPKTSCNLHPTHTGTESLLGNKLLPKLSQEMVDQANYLTGNIIHLRPVSGVHSKVLNVLRRRETLRQQGQHRRSQE